jgi:hypothetical protein
MIAIRSIGKIDPETNAKVRTVVFVLNGHSDFSHADAVVTNGNICIGNNRQLRF